MWVLVKGMDYEGSSAEGVFTTKANANNFVKKHYPDFKWDEDGDEWRNSNEYLIIYDMEVDEQ